jgi:uncharacterized membrane protein
MRSIEWLTVRGPEWGLRTLWLFTAVTLAGYATFGVNPQWLASVPQLAGIYGAAFRFFAVGHVWLAWGVLALFLAARVGTRWMVAFVAVYLISLGSELMGTRYGIPFGRYEYTSLMEPMWFGRVPIVIPLSWFYMAMVSYGIARSAPVAVGRRWGPIVVGAAVLVAWDLGLDPAMSYATPYWVWEDSGSYYGMPWVNLGGWFATGLLLMVAIRWSGAEDWVGRLSVRWMASFYLANLALPLGMNAAAGLWGAVAVTLGLVGVAWVYLLRAATSGGEASVALDRGATSSTGARS